MSELYFDDQPRPTTTPSPPPRASKLPFIALASRIATLASLIVSLIVIKSNHATASTGFRLTYNNRFVTYKYMFWVSMIGAVYALYQIPFALFYLRTRKRLVESYILLQVDFYCDKMMVFMLGTAVGAAFGATRDLKKYTLPEESELLSFFDMAYIPAVFLFIGCLASTISSILSSLALAKGG